MQIDLSSVLSGELTRQPIAGSIPQSEAALLTDNLTDIAVTSDIEIRGTAEDVGGYTRLTLTASFSYTGECSRCLEPIRDTFETTFSYPVRSVGSQFRRPSAAHSHSSEVDMETDTDVFGDEEDVLQAENGIVDVSVTVFEELALSFPSVLLCEEDCPGLCPVCGKPKRDGDCGCIKKEVDPRLKILEQLLEK